jgi:hypothetical protein
MPTLKGTPLAEQQLQFAALVKEHLSIFGPMPIDENGEGGSLLPPMNIELKLAGCSRRRRRLSACS